LQQLEELEINDPITAAEVKAQLNAKLGLTGEESYALAVCHQYFVNPSPLVA